VRRCAGMVRAARPIESGSTGMFQSGEAEPSPGAATVTTVRTASQAIRRAVSGWIGPTPPNAAGGPSPPERSVSAPTVTVRWGRCPCTSGWFPQRSCADVSLRRQSDTSGAVPTPGRISRSDPMSCAQETPSRVTSRSEMRPGQPPPRSPGVRRGRATQSGRPRPLSPSLLRR